MNCIKCIISKINSENADNTFNLRNAIGKNTKDGNEKLLMFLQNGGDPNTTVKIGEKTHSLVSHAFESDNFEAIKLLCKFGVNPNFKHDKEYPVLVNVLSRNQIRVTTITAQLFADVIECLVRAGADVNFIAYRGSPLYFLFRELLFGTFSLKRSLNLVFLFAQYGARYDLPYKHLIRRYGPTGPDYNPYFTVSLKQEIIRLQGRRRYKLFDPKIV